MAKFISARPRHDKGPPVSEDEDLISQFIDEFDKQQRITEAYLRKNHTKWTKDPGAFWGWPKKSGESARAALERIYSISDDVDNTDVLKPMRRRILRAGIVDLRDKIQSQMENRKLKMPGRGIKLMAMANHIVFMGVSDNGTNKIKSSTFNARMRDGERLIKLPKGMLLSCGKLSTTLLLVITQFAH